MGQRCAPGQGQGQLTDLETRSSRTRSLQNEAFACPNTILVVGSKESSLALWPCIPTDLTHAPLLDEAIKELQDNLVGITPYGRKISLLPGSPPDPRAGGDPPCSPCPQST
jgi:hypothetical protein